MSQDFKFKFDEMLDNDPTPPEQNAEDSGGNPESYPSASNTRNLGFVWQDGRRIFLNYSYLVSGEYKPAQNTIMLVFTTHEVMMKGIRLEGLFEALMSHLPRLIRCTDARYNATLEPDQHAVNDLKVEKAG